METTPSAADIPTDPTTTTASPTASATDPAATASPSSNYPPTYVGSAPAETKRRPRVETVVFGFIIIAVGVFMFLLSVGLRVDAELAMIFLLTLSGVALLGGALASIRKSPR